MIDHYGKTITYSARIGDGPMQSLLRLMHCGGHDISAENRDPCAEEFDRLCAPKRGARPALSSSMSRRASSKA